MSEKLLNIEDFQHILRKRFNNNPAITFKSAQFKSLTEDLNGFLGDHNMLEISYELNGEIHKENFFLKTKPTQNQFSSDMATSMNVYEKEIFFYDVLLKEYEKRGYNVSFAPKSYLCKNGDTLVLEDLNDRKFSLPGRTDFFNIDQTKSALKALAYFHGSTFLYEEQKSRELNRDFRLGEEYPDIFLENLMTLDDKKSLGYEFSETTLDCLLILIDLLPSESDDWKNALKRAMKEKQKDLPDIFYKDLKQRKACGHGDLWANNMMFRKENDRAVECVLLDYQIIRYFYPAFDVLVLLYTNTKYELRKQNTSQLLDYYYDCLTQATTGSNMNDILSRTEFQTSYDSLKYLAKFVSVGAHSFTFINVDKMKALVFNENEDAFKTMVLENRQQMVKEAFLCDELFRDVMTEDLYDIREMLLGN